MKLYSYIMTHDGGFSPNPFFNRCTLACCKPQIRKTASIGDWIVGIRGKGLCKSLGITASSPSEIFGIVYAMRVSDKITFKEFYEKREFKNKIPDRNAAKVLYKCGDNIYQPLSGMDFKQLPSLHSNKDGSENLKHKEKDLGGKYVLVSDMPDFWYFGSNPAKIPSNMTHFVKGYPRGTTGHTCKFTDSDILGFEKYMRKFSPGIHFAPSRWPNTDLSWQKFKVKE